jgi:hypothetical protein
VVYYIVDDNRPIYALMIYGKNEQVDLTSEQRRAATAFAAAIKAARRAR